MAISREVVAAVKERADIVQVIGERVSLSPSGSDYTGLCPFHGEKSPSFRVSTSRRMYHCFGCGAGGSVVDFVMALENLTFPEAVEHLALRFGVDLPKRRGEQGADRALDVLQAARAYYHELLMRQPEGEPARLYLRQREFGEADWQAFTLGFARDGWQNFTEQAARLGFSEADLMASGLARQGPTGRLYDMLRKRVVFPIPNEQGRPIAFGGRALSPEDQPKYLNTPETRLYHKSRVLFGLAQGREALRVTGRALLCEGYLDVMRLHAHGFREAVATCGTALTAEHLKVLERQVQRVVLVFDGDEAGIKAAQRSAPLFLERGLEARVVLLPGGMDPDDFLRKEGERGAEAFNALLAEATPVLEFLALQLLRRNGNTPEGKERTLQALLPVLSGITRATVRDVTVRYVADLIGVRLESVQALLSGGAAAPGTGGTHPPQRPPSREPLAHTDASLAVEPPPATRENRHPRRLLSLLLQERRLVTLARELLNPALLEDAVLRRLFEKLLRLTEEDLQQVGADELMELWPEQAPLMRSLLVEEGMRLQHTDEPETVLRYEVLRIREQVKDGLMQQFRRQSSARSGADPTADAQGLTPEELTAMEKLRQARADLGETREHYRRTHKLRPEVTLHPKGGGS